MGSCSSKEGLTHKISPEVVEREKTKPGGHLGRTNSATLAPKPSLEDNVGGDSVNNEITQGNVHKVVDGGRRQSFTARRTNNTADGSRSFSKSKEQYNKKQPVAAVTLNEKVLDDTKNTFQSGVYNRHLVDTSNDLSQLLKRDKFSVLGSRLLQEENRIFSKYSDQYPSRPPIKKKAIVDYENRTSFTTRCGNFDATKFRAANVANHPGHNVTVGQFQYKENLPEKSLSPQDEALIKKLEDEFSYL